MASGRGWVGGEENKDRKSTGYKSWRGPFVTLRCVIIISINLHHYLLLWSFGSKQISQEKKTTQNSKRSRPLASASLPNSFKTTSSHGRCQMLKEEMIRSDVCFWKTKSETAWIRMDIYLHRWPNEHSSISQKDMIRAISWAFYHKNEHKAGMSGPGISYYSQGH